MSIKTVGGTTGALLEVGSTSKGAYVELKDTQGNDLTHEQREKMPATQEALLVAGKNDEFATFFRTDRKGNTMMGNYNPELIENFEGGIMNVQKWTPASTTFVPAQSTLAGYTINSTSLATLSAVSILQSQRLVYKFPRVPLQLKSRIRHSMVSGAIADFGFGVPATTTLIVPNGVMFRMTNSGLVQGVITFNSTEIAISNILAKVGSNGNTIGAALNMSNSYYTSNYFVYDIVVDDDNAIFTIQDTATGEMVGYLSLPVPISALKMWGATALPVYYRMYNNTAPASAPTFIIGELQCLTLDMFYQGEATAGNLGLTSTANPFTGAPLTARANSTVPATATLSNTTAAYTQPDFGFVFAAVAGAETDYLISAFTVPAGSKFLCTGVTIDTFNAVAAVATTPTVMEWALGFNSSAASLATANSKRKQVGVQTFVVGAAAGAAASRIDVNFPPETTESGRFVQVALRMPYGTATATELFRGVVSLKGRFI
jgi:hypothetical protein